VDAFMNQGNVLKVSHFQIIVKCVGSQIFSIDYLGFQAIGRPQEAILCYQKAIQIRPDYAIAYGKCE
jgi:hypothetical protein